MIPNGIYAEFATLSFPLIPYSAMKTLLWSFLYRSFNSTPEWMASSDNLQKVLDSWRDYNDSTMY